MLLDNQRKINSEDIMIKCENICKTFVSKNEENEVIRNLNLEIRKNELVVLFGPGQCGKTVILNIIAGLENASTGNVYVNNNKIVEPGPDSGMVYQTTALFPWLTVMGNVEFGPKMLGVNKKERRKRAQHYIDLVGLQGFEKHFPVKLSGGMSQRVGIARAYCNNPEVILMDEPFGNLDAQTRYLMEEEIERICSTERKTVIFVTNNVEEAIYLADRIILLTNCPTTVRKEYKIDIPRPRSYVSEEFLRLRQEITSEMDETL